MAGRAELNRDSRRAGVGNFGRSAGRSERHTSLPLVAHGRGRVLVGLDILDKHFKPGDANWYLENLSDSTDGHGAVKIRNSLAGALETLLLKLEGVQELNNPDRVSSKDKETLTRSILKSVNDMIFKFSELRGEDSDLFSQDLKAVFTHCATLLRQIIIRVNGDKPKDLLAAMQVNRAAAKDDWAGHLLLAHALTRKADGTPYDMTLDPDKYAMSDVVTDFMNLFSDRSVEDFMAERKEAFAIALDMMEQQRELANLFTSIEGPSLVSARTVLNVILPEPTVSYEYTLVLPGEVPSIADGLDREDLFNVNSDQFKRYARLGLGSETNPLLAAMKGKILVMGYEGLIAKLPICLDYDASQPAHQKLHVSLYEAFQDALSETISSVQEPRFKATLVEDLIQCLDRQLSEVQGFPDEISKTINRFCQNDHLPDFIDLFISKLSQKLSEEGTYFNIKACRTDIFSALERVSAERRDGVEDVGRAVILEREASRLSKEVRKARNAHARWEAMGGTVGRRIHHSRVMRALGKNFYRVPEKVLVGDQTKQQYRLAMEEAAQAVCTEMASLESDFAQLFGENMLSSEAGPVTLPQKHEVTAFLARIETTQSRFHDIKLAASKNWGRLPFSDWLGVRRGQDDLAAFMIRQGMMKRLAALERATKKVDGLLDQSGDPLLKPKLESVPESLNKILREDILSICEFQKERAQVKLGSRGIRSTVRGNYERLQKDIFVVEQAVYDFMGNGDQAHLIDLLATLSGRIKDESNPVSFGSKLRLQKFLRLMHIKLSRINAEVTDLIERQASNRLAAAGADAPMGYSAAVTITSDQQVMGAMVEAASHEAILRHEVLGCVSAWMHETGSSVSDRQAFIKEILKDFPVKYCLKTDDPQRGDFFWDADFLSSFTGPFNREHFVRTLLKRFAASPFLAGLGINDSSLWVLCEKLFKVSHLTDASPDDYLDCLWDMTGYAKEHITIGRLDAFLGHCTGFQPGPRPVVVLRENALLLAMLGRGVHNEIERLFGREIFSDGAKDLLAEKLSLVDKDAVFRLVEGFLRCLGPEFFDIKTLSDSGLLGNVSRVEFSEIYTFLKTYMAVLQSKDAAEDVVDRRRQSLEDLFSNQDNGGALKKFIGDGLLDRDLVAEHSTHGDRFATYRGRMKEVVRDSWARLASFDRDIEKVLLLREYYFYQEKSRQPGVSDADILREVDRKLEALAVANVLKLTQFTAATLDRLKVLRNSVEECLKTIDSLMAGEQESDEILASKMAELSRLNGEFSHYIGVNVMSSGQESGSILFEGVGSLSLLEGAEGNAILTNLNELFSDVDNFLKTFDEKWMIDGVFQFDLFKFDNPKAVQVLELYLHLKEVVEDSEQPFGDRSFETMDMMARFQLAIHLYKALPSDLPLTSAMAFMERFNDADAEASDLTAQLRGRNDVEDALKTLKTETKRVRLWADKQTESPTKNFSSVDWVRMSLARRYIDVALAIHKTSDRYKPADLKKAQEAVFADLATLLKQLPFEYSVTVLRHLKAVEDEVKDDLEALEPAAAGGAADPNAKKRTAYKASLDLVTQKKNELEGVVKKSLQSFDREIKAVQNRIVRGQDLHGARVSDLDAKKELLFSQMHESVKLLSMVQHRASMYRLATGDASLGSDLDNAEAYLLSSISKRVLALLKEYGPEIGDLKLASVGQFHQPEYQLLLRRFAERLMTTMSVKTLRCREENGTYYLSVPNGFKHYDKTFMDKVSGAVTERRESLPQSLPGVMLRLVDILEIADDTSDDRRELNNDRLYNFLKVFSTENKKGVHRSAATNSGMGIKELSDVLSMAKITGKQFVCLLETLIGEKPTFNLLQRFGKFSTKPKSLDGAMPNFIAEVLLRAVKLADVEKLLGASIGASNPGGLPFPKDPEAALEKLLCGSRRQAPEITSLEAKAMLYDVLYNAKVRVGGKTVSFALAHQDKIEAILEMLSVPVPAPAAAAGYANVGEFLEGAKEALISNDVADIPADMPPHAALEWLISVEGKDSCFRSKLIDDANSDALATAILEIYLYDFDKDTEYSEVLSRHFTHGDNKTIDEVLEDGGELLIDDDDAPISSQVLNRAIRAFLSQLTEGIKQEKEAKAGLFTKLVSEMPSQEFLLQFSDPAIAVFLNNLDDDDLGEFDRQFLKAVSMQVARVSNRDGLIALRNLVGLKPFLDELILKNRSEFFDEAPDEVKGLDNNNKFVALMAALNLEDRIIDRRLPVDATVFDHLSEDDLNHALMLCSNELKDGDRYSARQRVVQALLNEDNMRILRDLDNKDTLYAIAGRLSNIDNVYRDNDLWKQFDLKSRPVKVPDLDFLETADDDDLIFMFNNPVYFEALLWHINDEPDADKRTAMLTKVLAFVVRKRVVFISSYVDRPETQVGIKRFLDTLLIKFGFNNHILDFDGQFPLNQVSRRVSMLAIGYALKDPHCDNPMAGLTIIAEAFSRYRRTESDRQFNLDVLRFFSSDLDRLSRLDRACRAQLKANRSRVFEKQDTLDVFAKIVAGLPEFDPANSKQTGLSVDRANFIDAVSFLGVRPVRDDGALPVNEFFKLPGGSDLNFGELLELRIGLLTGAFDGFKGDKGKETSQEAVKAFFKFVNWDVQVNNPAFSDGRYLAFFSKLVRDYEVPFSTIGNMGDNLIRKMATTFGLKTDEDRVSTDLMKHSVYRKLMFPEVRVAYLKAGGISNLKFFLEAAFKTFSDDFEVYARPRVNPGVYMDSFIIGEVDAVLKDCLIAGSEHELSFDSAISFLEFLLRSPWYLSLFTSLDKGLLGRFFDKLNDIAGKPDNRHLKDLLSVIYESLPIDVKDHVGAGYFDTAADSLFNILKDPLPLDLQGHLLHNDRTERLTLLVSNFYEKCLKPENGLGQNARVFVYALKRSGCLENFLKVLFLSCNGDVDEIKGFTRRLDELFYDGEIDEALLAHVWLTFEKGPDGKILDRKKYQQLFLGFVLIDGAPAPMSVNSYLGGPGLGPLRGAVGVPPDGVYGNRREEPVYADADADADLYEVLPDVGVADAGDPVPSFPRFEYRAGGADADADLADLDVDPGGPGLEVGEDAHLLAHVESAAEDDRNLDLGDLDGLYEEVP